MQLRDCRELWYILAVVQVLWRVTVDIFSIEREGDGQIWYVDEEQSYFSDLRMIDEAKQVHYLILAFRHV